MEHLENGTQFVAENAFEMSQLCNTIAAAIGATWSFLGTGNPCYDPYVMHRWSTGLHENGQNWDVYSVLVCPDGDYPRDRQRWYSIRVPR